MIQLFAPLVTPFNDDESVDFAALERNVKRYNDMPLDGYLVNGSSGESEMLRAEERLEVLRIVRGSTDRPVLAGLFATSLVDIFEQVDALEALVLEAVLVRTPSYFGRQLDQVAFFSALAEYSPHPVMVYQIPQNTGLRLQGEELWAIAQHSNIAGIKDSLGDLALLNEKCWPPRFKYFLGASALIQPGMAAGAYGGILALANVVPEMCRELLELSSDPGRLKEARQLQQRLLPLNRLLSGSNGLGLAGLKAACELRGLEAGHPRRPLRRLSSHEKGQLEAALSELIHSSI